MKKNIPYAFVFDIEGTLYKNRKLQNGVIDFFKKLKTENPDKVVMFITGMNSLESKKVVKMIEDGVGMPLNAIISSNAGNYVQDSEGRVWFDSPLKVDMIKAVDETVQSVAPGSIIVYRTLGFNCRERAMEADAVSAKIKKGGTVTLMKLLQILKAVDINTNPLNKDQIEDLANRNQIYSLEIVSLPNKAKAIVSALETKFPELVVNAGPTIQAGNNNKLHTLQFMLKDYGSNICYMGDNKNDEECLEFADTAVCLNSNRQQTINSVLREARHGKFKIATNNLKNEEVLNYIFTDECDEDALVQESLNCFVNAKKKWKDEHSITKIEEIKEEKVLEEERQQ